MNKTAKILYLLVGCIFPIFIGLLHTITHFAQLLTPEISEYLQKEFVILGQAQPLWNTWGIVSFMMGASFIIIGLLNVSIWRKNEILPILAIVAMIFYQICVTYVGYEFEQAFQLYGGMFGLLLLSICLVLTLKSKNNT